MKIYKHYSFDLWMTLIKSDPSFKAERAKFFYKHFNTTKKSIEDVVSIFRQVDVMCNCINEKTGNNIDADEMYLMVISLMNDFNTTFADVNLNWLYDEMELLLFKHMPTIYCDETFNSLDSLKQKSCSSFSISSNTAFIKGKTLRKVLPHLGLAPFFDFQIYSDEVGISKPDRRFFDLIFKVVNETDPGRKISPNEIVHIGDNPKADIEGAKSAGISSIQINTNNATILSLLN
jgi:putative hydrolase of the HAD superfamily